MDRYQIIVLVVAISFLLIIFAAVGMMIPRKDSDAPWPPVAGHCPDGWMEDANIQNLCAVSDVNKGLIKSGTASAKRNVNTRISTLTAKDPKKFDIRKGDWLTVFKSRFTVAYKKKTIFGKTVEMPYYKKTETTIGTYMVESVKVDKETKIETLVLNNTDAGVDGDVSYKPSSIMFDGMTVCDKNQWAKRWGHVRWDGISNYNKC